MVKTRVAVVRGGPSSEYAVSMQTGAEVIKALNDLSYTVTDIIVTKDKDWLVNGRIKSPDIALQTSDIVFIAMHGAYGEDGTVQRICERLHIPFTGSNSFPSSVAFNKDTTKRALHEHVLNLPKHVKLNKEHATDLSSVIKVIERSFGPEYVIKPCSSGSSHGVKIIHHIDDLAEAIKSTLDNYEECLVEEKINGIEATCGVLENFRDEDLYALPPVEIVPSAGRTFFDENAKYDGTTAEICPGRFSYEEKEKIAQLAISVHKALGLSQYSRTDCIVRNGEVFFLEVNTLPGLTNESLLPKAASAVGLSFNDLIEHLIKTARVY